MLFQVNISSQYSLRQAWSNLYDANWWDMSNANWCDIANANWLDLIGGN